MKHGGWVGIVAVGAMAFLAGHRMAQSAEHGGKEHGGTAATPAAGEHGGKTVSAEPSADEIRGRIERYVREQTGPDGTFLITDQERGDTRRLQFVRVHERVGKTGELYYACTDMRDVNTGELLDLDFDVAASGGNLEVVKTRIHKVDGTARYTYDEHDNRIPISPSAR